MTVEEFSGFVCDCCALKIANDDTSGCDGEHRENLATFPEVEVSASWWVTVREDGMDSDPVWCFGCGELIGHANCRGYVLVDFSFPL